eukprot:CAMPEP_0177440104 /NCGR_PEP_ID=MMETSP0369-20130122/3675_1 /TAXON_ID=447022 ORGANISM="Scrippsiella hangoei-like, Strain SHHI-4" /NCGR_SAMPLE_ID=MMETSP0369 /ASSEMBLY_ACC=CAM_ASM_000364 /LENGTH=85 /DNA_ID=CAMNT_0018911845 /DNA_START=250 /DNA_END=504 /DNA_ORIENTATION=+
MITSSLSAASAAGLGRIALGRLGGTGARLDSAPGVSAAQASSSANSAAGTASCRRSPPPLPSPPPRSAPTDTSRGLPGCCPVAVA